MPKIAQCFADFGTGSNFAIVLNTEGLYFTLFDESFRKIVISSDMIFVDGVGLKRIFRIFGFVSAKRIHGPDLFHHMLHLLDGRKRMIIGGTDEAHSLLFKKYPYLTSCKDRFFYSDKVDESDMDAIFRLIESFDPCEIYLCLGIKKQEVIGSLIVAKFPELNVVGVGAAIDFESGNINRSPLFAQKIGIEWLVRSLREPRMIPRVGRSLYVVLYCYFLKFWRGENPLKSLGFSAID